MRSLDKKRKIRIPCNASKNESLAETLSLSLVQCQSCLPLQLSFKSGPSEPVTSTGCSLNVSQHPDMSLPSLKLGASRRGHRVVAENFIRFGDAVNQVAVFKM